MSMLFDPQVLQLEGCALATLSIDECFQPFEIEYVADVGRELVEREKRFWHCPDRLGGDPSFIEGVPLLLPTVVLASADASTYDFGPDATSTIAARQAVVLIHGIAHRIVLLGRDKAMQHDFGWGFRVMLETAMSDPDESERAGKFQELRRQLGHMLPHGANEAATQCLTALMIEQAPSLASNRAEITVGLADLEHFLPTVPGGSDYLRYREWGPTPSDAWAAVGRKVAPGARVVNEKLPSLAQ